MHKNNLKQIWMYGTIHNTSDHVVSNIQTQAEDESCMSDTTWNISKINAVIVWLVKLCKFIDLLAK